MPPKHKRVTISATIGILSHPTGGPAGTTPLAHLVAIVRKRPVELHIITGPEAAEHFDGDPSVHTHPVLWTRGRWLPLVLLRYFVVQLHTARFVARVGERNPLWLFFIDGQNQILPLLTAKILRQRVVLIFAFSAVETFKRTNPVLALGARIISALACTMANRIVVYSPGIVDNYRLAPWIDKIAVASEHYVDGDPFVTTVPLVTRAQMVGYIGRFNEEKGILRLIEAIHLVLLEDPSVRFILIGDGLLRQEVEAAIDAPSLERAVELLPWVDRDQLPSFLNRMRLLVIPSFTEGLPNVMLESMACGTPVLAAPVGSIPDVIEDGVNGYLLADTAPETIAVGILGALRSGDLENVSATAQRYVAEEYSFDRAGERFWQAIESESGGLRRS